MSSITPPRSELVLEVAASRLVLRGDGSLLVAAEQALLVADLHLGKDASFRAAGVPVPHGMDSITLATLTRAIEQTKARHVYLMGDLIHDRSSMTADLIEAFTAWRERHAACQVTLVRGNHDRHVDQFPKQWQLHVVTEFGLGNFWLLHEVTEASLTATDLFQIGGHVHPVVQVGRGADRMRARCFVLDKRCLTLPALGPFKGGQLQAQSSGRKFYLISEGLVWPFNRPSFD